MKHTWRFYPGHREMRIILGYPQLDAPSCPIVILRRDSSWNPVTIEGLERNLRHGVFSAAQPLGIERMPSGSTAMSVAINMLHVA